MKCSGGHMKASMDWNSKGYRFTCLHCGLQSKRLKDDAKAMADYKAKANKALEEERNGR